MPDPYQYIDTVQDLDAWVTKLKSAKVIAVDTESDSFHRYREKVCLIQMTALGQDVIIDPLAVGDLSALRPIMADQGCVKIFHDAGYDLICLMRDFQFAVTNIFDTMQASRILGMRQFGLAAILQQHYGFVADKRFQRSDWGKRPLSAEQLHYARYDTHYLPALKDTLSEALAAAGRMAWAQEEFDRLPATALRQAPRPQEPTEAFWRVTGARALTPAGKGRLQHLFAVREGIAKRLDKPVFKVLADDVLLNLAAAPPERDKPLSPRPGLPRHAISRFGMQLLDGLHDAPAVLTPPPKGTNKRRRGGRALEPPARERYEALRVVRREVADSLDIEPEVALGNACLEALAKDPPAKLADVLRHPDIAGWRAPLLGEALWKGLQQPQAYLPVPSGSDAAILQDPLDGLALAEDAAPSAELAKVDGAGS